MKSLARHASSLAIAALVTLSGMSVACASDSSETETAKQTTAAKPAAKPATPPPAAPAPAPPAATPATPATGDELVVLETSVGDVVIDLFEDKTPGHAANFKKNVTSGYYDGSPFHRVIEGFMAQGGGKFGAGGSVTDVGYTIPAEIVPGMSHHRGAVAAARTNNPERASSGSQFYISFAPAAWLDNQYTIFGEVVSGMENVDKITKGAPGSGSVIPAEASVIKRAYLKPKA